MLLKSLALPVKCIFIGAFIIVFGSCKKTTDTQTVNGDVSNIAFDFNLGYQKDTIIILSDTEIYRIYFANSTGESRCPNLNCTGCGVEVGNSGTVVKVYNFYKDSLSIQLFVSGCILSYPDSAVALINLNDLKPGFNIKLGVKEIAPYPGPNSYSGNGVDWNAYRGTFRIVQ